MSSSTQNPANAEWALQERAFEEERDRMAVGYAAPVNRYRLIARVLSEPLLEGLPDDFAATVAAAAARRANGPSAVSWRQLAVLGSIGALYLATMAAAAVLMHTDLTLAHAELDGWIVVAALSIVLSQAVGRIAALTRGIRALRLVG
jgi:hypothetical protein